jgi:hypothetical protein
VSERLGTTDRWGPRSRERESERVRKETAPIGQPHRAARGREGRERVGETG